VARLHHLGLLPAVLLLAAASPACSSEEKKEAPAAVASGPTGGAPAAPSMPSGWTVQSDVDVTLAELPALESKLGAPVKAVRNTTYAVGGGTRVQINTIVPADARGADTIYRTLSMSKPAYALARKGDVIYEMVGTDAATDAIKQAHTLLTGG
jgi:hypothetical protein